MHWIKNAETEPELFIDRFMGGESGNPNTQEKLRDKFMNGYCWYFAHMLQLAFGRGLVCLTAPIGHFVWVDTNEQWNTTNGVNLTEARAYDIEGLYRLKDHDALYLIPEEYLDQYLNEFQHTNKPETGVSKKEIIDIIQNFCKHTNISYNRNIEDWLG